jgi:hypothetical protein
MLETATKINERLDKRGKRLEDVTKRELGEICHDVTQSIGGSVDSDHSGASGRDKD